MKFHSDGYRVTAFFQQGCAAVAPQGYRVTGFSPKGCAALFPKGYRVTAFFPKVKTLFTAFSSQGYRFSPPRLPVPRRLNHSNSKRNCQKVTGLPVRNTSVLYITRKKATSIFFLAHSVRYQEKSGNPVTFACKYPPTLGNFGYRSPVTTGNSGNPANFPRNHSIRVAWRSLS